MATPRLIPWPLRVRARFFLAFFLVVGIAVWALLETFSDELRPALLQSAEETMIDSANLLADMAKEDLENGTLQDGRFAQAVDQFLNRRFDAEIWGVHKLTPNHRIYVTNDKGIVLFDSARLAVGQDYSQWRDVYYTLRGQYGARSTRTNPDDPASSTMFVAAPVLDEGRIIGVLSLGKPSNSIDPFLDRSTRKLRLAGLIVVVVSLALGFALSWWLARAFSQLADYATAVSQGKRAELPDVGRGELGELAHAVETMRQELEGKQYVEHYVHTLTHEMKSPLAAIKGAAELIDADMTADQQQRFLNHIHREADFLQQLIERLLDLAVLEKRQSLRETVEVDLTELVRQVTADKQPLLASKQLTCDINIPVRLPIMGEPFLLRQCLSNLLDNAMAFSPTGGHLQWQGQLDQDGLQLSLQDQGSGIPDYALPRVFERFYSLPRPDGSRKSSGLGLSFVQQAIVLHGGQITLRNLPEGGACASLTFPHQVGIGL
ncbi:two-component system sensor histidine kinase CreC [Chitinivorax sp. B]|uniref:two-component system sensor histidine kinase CreC n=1 Tax=Chitinivorax sp. B TaxID=2502235 RepID=UPI0010F62A25|nr:two-component system sensor histidine kinase CreC [Chitinivorax sp. B]